MVFSPVTSTSESVSESRVSDPFDSYDDFLLPDADENTDEDVSVSMAGGGGGGSLVGPSQIA